MAEGQMRKQVLAIIIGVLLVLSVFSVLQLWQIKPAQADYQTITHIVGQSGRGVTETDTLEVTMALTPTSGNALIAVIGTGNYTSYVTVSSITETNVVWTYQIGKQANEAYNSGFGYENVEIWYGVVSTGASKTVTIALNTVTLQAVANIYEYSGLLTTGFLDKNATNSGHTDSTDTGTTATTTQTVELWIGGIAAIENTSNQTAPTNSFTLYDGNYSKYSGSSFYLKVGYLEKIVSSTGTANSGTTCAGNDWAGCIATFKAASSPTEGEGDASDWAYRISDNATSCYILDNTGAVIYNNAAFHTVFNTALAYADGNATKSIYIYPDNYTTSGILGPSWYGGTAYSNIYVQFGPATNITRTSGTGNGDYLLQFHDYSYPTTTNLTITCNGTVTFNAANYCDGFELNGQVNSTYSNMTIQHLEGNGYKFARSRYCDYENLTVFSPHETSVAGMCFEISDVQYGTFYNIEVDGNDQGLSEGFYIGDWDGNANWNGSYFNTFTKIWVHGIHRNGFYLNGGGTGYGVHNNTFSNCTAEDNAQDGYFGIKLRPAQNNTFTDIIIRNMTGGVTTGTSYDDSETAGNTTGNYVQARCFGLTTQAFTLATDGSDQSIDNNFFNLTFTGGVGTYFANPQTSVIHDNICYLNFTDTHAAIYLEQGYISDNTFYLNFSRVSGHPDIWHWSGWTSITDNTFYVYETSGNPNGLYDFVNGTQGNIVVYPYSYSGPPPTLVSITIISPTNTTYSSSTITVEIDVEVSGSTLDTVLWDLDNASSWVYVSNQTYTIATQMKGISNGEHYTLYVWANATDGTEEYATVMFSVSISAEGIVSIYVNTWWSGWW